MTAGREHRGFDWPEGGGDPYDRRTPWPARLFWAHERPSRLFTEENTPSDDEVLRHIPIGYTTLVLLERVGLITLGEKRRRVLDAESTPGRTGPFQPYQMILRPPPGGRSYLMVGANWPLRYAVRDAVDLGARTGEVVLLCRVLGHRAWH